MASISISPALQSPSFESRSPPSSPSRAHRRQASRNPNAAPLPNFSFNPSAVDGMQPTQFAEATVDENTMDLGTGKMAKAVPLPEFKFNPGASLPPQPERSPSPIHPILQEMALNQQRASRSARPAPLPAFTFAPHTSSGQPSPSPTKSAFTDMPHSAGSGMGHRRGGSEFVGAVNGGPQLVSSSPEKPEYRPPPAPARHTHRRSQAVSVSDIETSELIKAAALSKARAGSTPTTPSEVAQQFHFPRPSPPSASSSHSSRSPPASPRRRDSLPGPRPRVGFADRVEMIPRPLSLISSETEGSCSTVRGHSVSGSINSIAASPTPLNNVSAVSSPVSIEIESPLQRPRTADPTTLLFSGPERAEKARSMANLPKRPLSASDSPAVTSSGSPPNKKKHFWSSNSPNLSPTPTPKIEKENPLPTSDSLSLEPVQPVTRPKVSPERAGSIKKRKYHTWTSGIFSRKSGKRSTKMKSKRTPTPPALTRRASDKINEIFDADDTVVLREPSPTIQRSRPRPQTALPSVPSYEPPRTVDEATSPILDLDAAMGILGDETPTHGTPTRTAAARMAKLHSAERRGNTDAFGSFHKRSESAPSMQPVHRASFNIHRLGSNSSLHEVFDEEEEDNFLAETVHSSDAGSSRKASNPSEIVAMDVENRRQPGLALDKPMDGLGLSVQSDSSDAVVIVDPEDDLTQTENRSSNSTIEAPIFGDLSKRPATSPMAFGYPAPQSQYASSTEGRTTCTSASMISSPDPDHISFDNFPRTNRYLTEPSPDFVLRASNEDLPSLSDSVSSGAVPRISSSANTRSSSEQRAQSVCVPSTSRSSNTAWKRASLASLNRLIPGSANGSKLKFETVPDTSSTEEKTRKKSNRISKLMHFWRSKEEKLT